MSCLVIGLEVGEYGGFGGAYEIVLGGRGFKEMKVGIICGLF